MMALPFHEMKGQRKKDSLKSWTCSTEMSGRQMDKSGVRGVMSARDLHLGVLSIYRVWHR